MAQEKDKDHLMLTRSDYSFDETNLRLAKTLKQNNSLTLLQKFGTQNKLKMPVWNFQIKACLSSEIPNRVLC